MPKKLQHRVPEWLQRRSPSPTTSETAREVDQRVRDLVFADRDGFRGAITDPEDIAREIAKMLWDISLRARRRSAKKV